MFSCFLGPQQVLPAFAYRHRRRNTHIRVAGIIGSVVSHVAKGIFADEFHDIHRRFGLDNSVSVAKEIAAAAGVKPSRVHQINTAMTR